MLKDLRSVPGRYRLIELLMAFALGFAVVQFVNQVVNNLIVTPVDSAASGPGFTTRTGPLQFVIGNRIFGTEGILSAGSALLIVIALAALYARLHEDVLWRDGGDVATCPHCLSEIPAEARVCSQCTRDIAPDATPT